MKEKNKNTFFEDYENFHPKEPLEWLYALGFLESVNGDKKWCFRETFKAIRHFGKILYSTGVIDQKEKHEYFFGRWLNYKKDNTLKNGFHILDCDSYIYGNYPEYTIRFVDPENKIKGDLKYKANATPFWIAQDITGGWLPAGLGVFRYGFIPKNDIFGKLKIKDKKYDVRGKGYLEHVYGNLNYRKPVSRFSEFNRIISIYAKLITWWMGKQNVSFPRSIGFTTENTPLGYDWAWAIFDNEWSIFYGNLLFWMMDGPATGVLYLTKDDKTDIKFYNISYRYIQTKFVKDFDCLYPTEFEINAKDGKKKMYLHFKMTSKPLEAHNIFRKPIYWTGFILCEAPGYVEGYYKEGDKKIKLSGIAKLEPQRQISKFGHNSMKFNFLLPPKGVGVKFDFDFHYFKKKLSGNIQLMPRLKLKLNN